MLQRTTPDHIKEELDIDCDYVDQVKDAVVNAETE